MDIQICSPANWERTLLALFSDWPAESSAQRVAHLLRQADKDPGSLRGLLNAVAEGVPWATAWITFSPGRLAGLHGPQVLSGASAELRAAAVDALLQAALQRARDEGAHVLQALLAEPPDGRAAHFVGAGFQELARLDYLACLEARFPKQPPRLLRFEPIGPAGLSELVEMLPRFYRDARDMPALDGWREPADVVAGYAALGTGDTGLWSWAYFGTQRVGCVLLAFLPELRTLDLVYLALFPEFRGRGWGRELVRQAQWQARLGGAHALWAVADAANERALRTYAGAGFVPYEQRRAFGIKLA